MRMSGPRGAAAGGQPGTRGCQPKNSQGGAACNAPAPCGGPAGGGLPLVPVVGALAGGAAAVPGGRAAVRNAVLRRCGGCIGGRRGVGGG